MVCSCGYRFALNPKTDQMADGKLLALVRKASANDTQYFTFEGLYTAWCQHEAKQAGGRIGCGWVALGLGAVLTALGLGFRFEWPPIFFFGGIIIVVGFAAMASGWLARRKIRDGQVLLRNVRAFARLHGEFPRQLRDDRPLATPPPDWNESDIYDYGVERILIVERDLMVDLLVMNGFHSQERSLIVSEAGYPEYVLPHVERILREQPDTPLYLLHDASHRGADMKRRVSASGRLAQGATEAVDLGLRLEDARKLKRLAASGRRAQFPLDAVPYGVLSAGIAACMVENLTLGELIDQRETDDQSSFG